MSSVRLSVTLVDQGHISWKSWKLIARTISPTLSLFVAQKPSYLLDGEIWGRLKVEWEKVVCWSTKTAIFLKSAKIEEKLPWRAYGNSPTLSRTVPSPTPYRLLFPKIGGSQPSPQTPIATCIISGTGTATKSGKVAMSIVRDGRNFQDTHI